MKERSITAVWEYLFFFLFQWFIIGGFFQRMSDSPRRTNALLARPSDEKLEGAKKQQYGGWFG